MKKISEYLFLWAIGGILYYLIEILFRGMSHWTMFVLGGICFQFFAFQGERLQWKEPFWIQVFRCSLFVLCMEFITGIIVNKWLHFHVWDYTGLPLQVLGQICVPFAILFSGLCILGIPLSGYLLYWIYKEPKPTFWFQSQKGKLKDDKV